MGDVMRKTLTLLAAAALAAAIATPAAADGRRGGRAVGGWAVGAISANVITPDYYPYYGSFYSYNGPNYYPGPYPCWRWRHGYRFWVC
jgi:hypothetical protein